MFLMTVVRAKTDVGRNAPRAPFVCHSLARLYDRERERVL